jgi:mono/diheme cytochrome c family protein
VNARAPGAAAALLAAAAAWAAAPPALTPKPQADYMLNCQGCHLPDGSGAPGRVPSLRTSLARLVQSEAGRRYLVQVPGAAQSALADAELAQVLNWMVGNLSARPPREFRAFGAQEVAGYRATPLVAVRATRARLLGSEP